MRKFNLICLWIALFLSPVLRAGIIDSLEVELASQTDAKRIDILNELAWHYQNTNANEAMSFANLALKESRELNYIDGEGKALQRVGLLYLLNHKNKEAIAHFLEASSIYRAEKDWAELSKTNLSIGNVYMDLEEFEKAQEFYQKAEAICIKHNILDQYEIVANNIGASLENYELYDEALKTYRKTLLYADTTKQNYSNLLLNISSAHFYNYNLDSALIYNDRARIRYEQTADTNGLVKAWLNKGVYFETEELYNDGIKSYYVAGDFARSISDFDALYDIEQGLMLCYGALGEVDSMYVHFENGLDISEALINSKTDKALHELSVKYETAKKEAALFKSEQEREFEIERGELKQNTIYYLLGIIGVIAILLILLYLFFRQRQKSANLKMKVANNEIESLISDQELKMYQSLIQGQDAERKRISEDLHDRIGGLLAAINLQFEGAEEDEVKRIKNVRDLVDESIREVRSISHNLSDGRIDQVGFISAIQGLQKTIESSGKIKFELFTNDYQQKLEVETEREVYKVVLELISNTLKHAEATSIVVQLVSFDNEVQLIFEDNGVGFDEKMASKGLGLKSMTQRIENLNGKFNVDSKKGHGTTVIIEIPVQ